MECIHISSLRFRKANYGVTVWEYLRLKCVECIHISSFRFHKANYGVTVWEYLRLMCGMYSY